MHMKIAICSSNDDSRANLIKSFISQWPMYATPADNIFNDIAWDSDDEKLNESYKKMNEVEQILFSKLIFIEKQLEKYKDHGYLIFNGSSPDILVHSLILCEQGYVSEEFVEKVIYHNKKILRLMDVVYFIPNMLVDENSDDEKKVLESVYWNFYENYQTEFNTSPFFDHANCASILLLESDSPINEIKMLLDKNGNLEGTSQGGTDGDLISTEKLQRALKANPKLLEAALESLKGGTPRNSGSVSL